MINLLPPDIRASQRYAHSNTLLFRWMIGGLLAVVGMAIIGGLGVLYTQQTSDALADQIQGLNASLEAQDLQKIKAETEDINNSLKLAVTVLSKEIMFSQLLEKLGNVTPNNAILTDLNISQEEKGVDITAQTTDYGTATQVQVNLTNTKNQLFQKADIVSITCDKAPSNSSDTDETVAAKYPCTVVIRALFVDNNPHLFINQGKKKS